MLLVLFADIEPNAELKEGTIVAMNCSDIEETCQNKGRVDPTCESRWTVRPTANQQTIFLCKRYFGIQDDTKCYIPNGPYKDRTSYQGSGIVHIPNVRKDESGIYSCECDCAATNFVESRFYYGIIIVRK